MLLLDNVQAAVLQGSILEPLFFVIYINDLQGNLTSNSKICADNTLFSTVTDINATAYQTNTDSQNNRWAYQWKMGFNPDPSKQALEVIFSHKTKITAHP